MHIKDGHRGRHRRTCRIVIHYSGLQADTYSALPSQSSRKPCTNRRDPPSQPSVGERKKKNKRKGSSCRGKSNSKKKTTKKNASALNSETQKRKIRGILLCSCQHRGMHGREPFFMISFHLLMLLKVIVMKHRNGFHNWTFFFFFFPGQRERERKSRHTSRPQCDSAQCALDE